MDTPHILLCASGKPATTKTVGQVLERRDEGELCEVLEQLIRLAAGGASVDQHVISVIKNASSVPNRRLKKLLHLFWPMVDCYTAEGALKPHIILVCNSILQDLQHPNEHVVCSALRCVVNFPVREVIQHFVQAIPPLLAHAQPIVRGAAATAMQALSIRYPDLLPVSALLARFVGGTGGAGADGDGAEADPNVLHKLLLALVDLLPARAPLAAQSVLARMPFADVCRTLYSVLPPLLHALQGLPGAAPEQAGPGQADPGHAALEECLALVRSVFDATAKHQGSFPAETLFDAGMCFWKLSFLLAGVGVGASAGASTGAGAGAGAGTGAPPSRTDAAALALRLLLASTRDSPESCARAAFAVVGDSLALHRDAYARDDAFAGIPALVVSAVCASGLSDDARLPALQGGLLEQMGAYREARVIVGGIAASAVLASSDVRVVDGAAQTLRTLFRAELERLAADCSAAAGFVDSAGPDVIRELAKLCSAGDRGDHGGPGSLGGRGDAADPVLAGIRAKAFAALRDILAGLDHVGGLGVPEPLRAQAAGRKQFATGSLAVALWRARDGELAQGIVRVLGQRDPLLLLSAFLFVACGLTPALREAVAAADPVLAGELGRFEDVLAALKIGVDDLSDPCMQRIRACMRAFGGAPEDPQGPDAPASPRAAAAALAPSEAFTLSLLATCVADSLPALDTAGSTIGDAAGGAPSDASGGALRVVLGGTALAMASVLKALSLNPGVHQEDLEAVSRALSAVMDRIGGPGVRRGPVEPRPRPRGLALPGVRVHREAVGRASDALSFSILGGPAAASTASAVPAASADAHGRAGVQAITDAALGSIRASHDVFQRDHVIRDGSLSVCNDLASLRRVVQLSGDSDRIYAEALVSVTARTIRLDTVFINRSAEHVQDLRLELYSTAGIRLAAAGRGAGQGRGQGINLDPKGFARASYALFTNTCESGVIFGNVLATFTQKKTRDAARHRDVIHRIQEIRVNVRDFLVGQRLAMPEYKQRWGALPWEHTVPLRVELDAGQDGGAVLDAVVRSVEASTNALPVQPPGGLEGPDGDAGGGSSASDSGSGSLTMCRYYALTTLDNTPALLCVSAGVEGRAVVGETRVRTGARSLGLSLADCLRAGVYG